MVVKFDVNWVRLCELDFPCIEKLCKQNVIDNIKLIFESSDIFAGLWVKRKACYNAFLYLRNNISTYWWNINYLPPLGQIQIKLNLFAYTYRFAHDSCFPHKDKFQIKIWTALSKNLKEPRCESTTLCLRG